MKLYKLFSPIIFLALLIFSTSSFAEGKGPYTFVLVHGASGGAWDWKTVDKHLSANNHTVYRPTLTGLGEKYHLSSPDINLTTHINDIVNVIIFEDLYDVVLVGHSYGGMVITGVMDRIPQRIRHVTFVDAMVPDDGMSMNDVKPLKASYKIIDGMIHFPWIDATGKFPRDVIQPFNTYTEAVSYKNLVAHRLNVSYVAFLRKGKKLADRAKDPSWIRAESRFWTISTFEGNHVAYRKKPKEFALFLEKTVEEKNKYESNYKKP